MANFAVLMCAQVDRVVNFTLCGLVLSTLTILYDCIWNALCILVLGLFKFYI